MIDPIAMNRMMDASAVHFRTAVSDTEAHELQRLAREGNVLEIGSWTGYSAYRMAFSANRIDCVDPYVDPGGPKVQEFLDNTAMYDTIFMHIGRSADIVPILQPIYDLVFIDGDHSYDGCRLDLELAFDKVKFGGVIALHDYALPEQFLKDRPNLNVGVREAVADFFKTHCYFKMVRKPRQLGDPVMIEDEYDYRPPKLEIIDTLAWFRVNWRE